MVPDQRWQRAARILCVRLDTIGDVLMTTPALRALKESRCDRHLTLLTSTAGAAATALIPEIDDTIIYDAPWLKATPLRRDSRPEHAMAQRLRRERFDAAVIFTVFSQNPLPAALLCYLADVPLRLAYCHENPYQLLTTWIADPDPAHGIRHEVRRQLDLVAAVGCRTADERLSLRYPEAARQRMRALLRAMAIHGDRPWAVVHPGASAPSRRYPPEGFAVACQALAIEHGWQIVFTGAAHERELIADIRGQMSASAHSLAGRLELAELAALVAEAPVLITNNTGPAHIAAAVGTPVVDLYALTNPQHTPWLVPSRVLCHDVPCRNCFKSVCPEQHHDCLRKVAPEAVVAAALELAQARRRVCEPAGS